MADGERYNPDPDIPLWGNLLAGAFGRNASNYVRKDTTTDPSQEVLKTRIGRELYRHAVLTGEVPTTLQENESGVSGLFHNLGLGTPNQQRPLNEDEIFAANLGLLFKQKLELDSQLSDIQKRQAELNIKKTTQEVDPEVHQLEREQLQAETDLVKQRKKHLEFEEDNYREGVDHEKKDDEMAKRFKAAADAVVIKPEISKEFAKEKTLYNMLQKDNIATADEKMAPEMRRALEKEMSDTKMRVEKLQKILIRINAFDPFAMTEQGGGTTATPEAAAEEEATRQTGMTAEERSRMGAPARGNLQRMMGLINSLFEGERTAE